MDKLFSTIQFSDVVNILALLVALLSLALAWYEIWMSHRVVVDLLDITSSGVHSIHENNCQPFRQIRVVIRNRGIDLHNPSLEIQISGLPEPHEWFSICIPRENNVQHSPEHMARGMVGVFILKSYNMRSICPPADYDLSSKNVRIRLVLYSQGFECLRWKFGGLRDRVICSLQSMSYRIQNSYQKEFKPEEKFVIPYSLPVITGDRIILFFNGLRQYLKV